ncbi:MAG: hypothetical protein H0U95_05310 [Bacteroidetes bacterium]|nr:hypothetical protein [Bacteroidota bacterium]
MEELFNETKILTLELGRNLLKNTTLSDISDDDLQQILEDIKTFCEINFEIYLDYIHKIKMMQCDKDEKLDKVKIISLENKEDKNSSQAA